ncbi:hypothetical protein DQ824_22825 [Salmonella enterica subsp. enterica serovar Newport]|nr:hypothetical protein [Salmonella enterica subsp. enterica serovar Newport]
MELIIIVVSVFLVFFVVYATGKEKDKKNFLIKEKRDFLSKKGWKSADFIWFKRDLNSEIGFIVTANDVTVVSVTFKRVKGKDKCLFFSKIIPTGEIVETTVTEDDTITQSSKANGSVIGRGLIGSAVFGVTGAVIGATSAVSNRTIESKRDISKISLNIVSSNIDDCLNRFVVYEGRLDVTSKEYNTLKEKLTSLFTKIKVASGQLGN